MTSPPVTPLPEQFSQAFASIPISKQSNFTVCTLDDFMKSIQKSDLVELNSFPHNILDISKNEELISSQTDEDYTFVIVRRVPSHTFVCYLFFKHADSLFLSSSKHIVFFQKNPLNFSSLRIFRHKSLYLLQKPQNVYQVFFHLR